MTTLQEQQAQAQEAQQAQMDAVANNFLQRYYFNLDNIETRPGLKQVYRDFSVMKYEGKTFMGVDRIMEKLMSLPQLMARRPSAIDVDQIDNRLVIIVSGQMKTDPENEHLLPFNHTFILGQEGQDIYVVKEIFRLSLHDV